MMNLAEINALESTATLYFANAGNKFFYQFRFGAEECLSENTLMKEVLLYLYVLSTKSVYKDGTLKSDSYITDQDDWDTMLMRLKDIVT